MFTIDSTLQVRPYPTTQPELDPADDGLAIATRAQLSELIQGRSGEWAVALWNGLPGVAIIDIPPGEVSAKFRNKATAVERIWNKLAELYPDAILESDMPKKRERHAKATKAQTANPVPNRRRKAHSARTRGTKPLETRKSAVASENGHKKSAWAEELTAKLIDEFRPGQAFTVEQVYGFEASFRPKHRENKNIRAKLRQTLAILRGAGFLKQVGRGKYERKAAR